MSDKIKVCKHPKMLNKEQEESINFCYLCGSAIIIEDGKKKATVKPYLYSNESDLDPVEILKVMKNQEIHFTNSFASKYYKDKRNDKLKLLKILVSKCRFTDKSFHLAALYLDIIANKTNVPENKLELISIACLLLAGI
jgi:hypothetical protein